MRRAVIVLALALVAAAGCSSANKGARAAPPLLPLDPTEQQDLAEWWSDGKRLLYLDPSGTYRLFPGNDRYHDPVERGRWWRQSYAALWLEPYEPMGKRSTRIAITKDEENKLVLDVPAVGSLAPLAAPPAVIEDRLIGDWSGDAGDLRLGRDLRYRLSPRVAASAASLAGQQGAWAVEDDALLLQPDSAALAPTLIRIRQQGDAIVLESPSGALTRSAGAPPANRS
jgi:hypothetical protein